MRLFGVKLLVLMFQLVSVKSDLNDLSLEELSLLEEMKNYEMNLQEGKSVVWSYKLRMIISPIKGSRWLDQKRNEGKFFWLSFNQT